MIGSIVSSEVTRIANNMLQPTGGPQKAKPAAPQADNAGRAAPAPVNQPGFSRKPPAAIKSVRVTYSFSTDKAISSARQLSPLRFEIKGANLPIEAIKIEVSNIKIEKIVSASDSEIIVEGRAGKKDGLRYRRVKLLSEGKKVAEKTILLTLTPTTKCPDNPSNKRLRELGYCK